jgi:alkanesulfonate monooxygenase SsuD/methylene tetrahydromethanopterin reductase-like flavin-dependent oxidoreductase (luciferase family)
MKLSIIQECDAPNGVRPPVSRYQELVREAIAAEEAGFSTYMVSEQHFNDTIATLSAPESFFGYLAAKTSTIRLRVASFVLLSFNHPIRSAERAATLDVLSDGRFEIGTARSNNPQTLRIFGVDPNHTRAMWEESIQIIRGALTYENFEFHGQIWDVPPVTVMPRPLQLPHPPIHVSATSIETHFNSGRYGLGVMTGNSLPGGWDYLVEALGAYQKGLAEVDVAGGRLTESRAALAAVAYCARTEQAALDDASEVAGRFVGLVAQWYDQLSAASKDYKAFAGLRSVVDRKDSLPQLIDRSPYLTIGTPEFFIERCRKLHDLGYGELICRIDGMSHEQHLASIKLLGEEVIPEIEKW